MPYDFLKAYLPINGVSQKDKYKGLFQENLNRQFYNSSDIWTIEEETGLGTDVWQEVDVRVVTNVISNETGAPLGNDFRKLLFKEIDHATNIGWMYYFDDSYWLVINADIDKNLAASCTVRRCNNVLRWLDQDGGYYEVPCAIDFTVKENRDFATAGTALVAPAAQMELMCQFNTKSNKIRPNQRFLFGNSSNWNAYRVLGGGVNNYTNLKTTDNMSAGLLRLSLQANYVNFDTDDTTNGIADYLAYVYSISVLENPLSIQIGGTQQFHATITVNGDTVSRGLTWTTDDEDIATVGSTGLLTAISDGTCTIRVQLENNENVYVDIPVTVLVTPIVESEIILTPNVNYVLEAKSTTFTVGLYENGVLQPDAFTFSLNPNTVPFDHYVYTELGNTFTIENVERFLEDTLDVTATTTGPLSRVFSITLRGAW